MRSLLLALPLSTPWFCVCIFSGAQHHEMLVLLLLELWNGAVTSSVLCLHEPW